MRLSFALLAVLVPSTALAQTKEIDDAVKRKLATAKWVLSLEHPQGGFYFMATDPLTKVDPRPGLRATSAAVRTLKYLGVEIPNKEKHAAFVLGCLDPKTGAFVDPPGTPPEVALTSVGVMAAVELGIPKEKFARAMDFLKENAKTFEEVRIGAAAVEAWGVKDCPFKLDEWQAIATKELATKLPPIQDGGARMIGSIAAFTWRLGLQKGTDSKPKDVALLLDLGRRADGGWGKQGEKASDLESSYRVMRAFMLLKEKPKDAVAVREFIESHRNKDGGYATKPGEKSNMSGTYYATIITKWLDELEAKK